MSPVALTVGTFDGVHLGHRRLIASAGRLAREAGLELVALTLDRHPLSLLHPERAPQMLTGLDHKLELLAAADGVTRAAVLRFDQARADQSPESFLVDTIVGDLGGVLLVVGANFRFGHGGAGDLAFAEAVGRRVGLSVVGVPLVEAAPGAVVSSSAIRRLVAAGHLARAAGLLGRPHELRGRLAVAGDARPSEGALDGPGRHVRLAVAPELLLPPPGTYEVVVRLLGRTGVDSPTIPATATIAPAGERGGPAGGVTLTTAPGAGPPTWPASPAGAMASVAFVAASGAPATASGRHAKVAAGERVEASPAGDGSSGSAAPAAEGPVAGAASERADR